jgi:hypothetical protein
MELELKISHPHYHVGRFVYPKKIILGIEEEANKLGLEWLPIKSGMFGGSLERFQNAKNNFNIVLREFRNS